jgi:hypothetical protein
MNMSELLGGELHKAASLPERLGKKHFRHQIFTKCPEHRAFHCIRVVLHFILFFFSSVPLFSLYHFRYFLLRHVIFWLCIIFFSLSFFIFSQFFSCISPFHYLSPFSFHHLIHSCFFLLFQVNVIIMPK